MKTRLRRARARLFRNKRIETAVWRRINHAIETRRSNLTQHQTTHTTAHHA